MRPVRVGNGAVDQRQSDVLGEVMISLAEARRLGVSESDESWAVQRALVDDLAGHWDRTRPRALGDPQGQAQHFTHSRIMVWAAFDRAVRAVEDFGHPGDVERWRALRDTVHAEVCDRGYDAERNTFTQHYDTREVDAALTLLIPTVGFLPADDPRVQGTVKAVEEDLLRDGFLLRYRTQTGVDGLPGDENPFLACSFWLAEAYARCGRLDDAHALMRRLLAIRNDLGLLSEEVDPATGRLLGNFPQAFSHLALVRAADAIEQADRDAGRRGSVGSMALSDSALLDALDRHSALLEATAEGLDDVSAPSLCPGWTRGHVLSHLARNAEAIAGLCRAAVDGEQRAMGPSDEARDADVNASAGRDAATQAEDVRTTDHLVAEQLARLRPEHADVSLERTPGRRLVPAGRLPFMRLREVVLHHLDLDAGFGLADVEPELTADLLGEEVERLQACDPPPDLTLRTDEGDEWTTGLGTAEVTGTRTAVLGWLARGLTDGLTGDPLPRLPEGR